MADFSSYTHKWRANADVYQQNASSKISKRNRQPLSCLPCRSRKLKCDRGHPCETCVKRGDEATCSYTKNIPAPKADNNNRGKAHERLRQLEQLVMQMVDTNDGSNSNLATQSPIQVLTPPESDLGPHEGQLQRGTETSKYLGSTHWSAILQNIQELKSAICGEQGLATEIEDPDDDGTPEEDILFGASRPITLQQVIDQCLPTRAQTDRRLSSYFNAKYLVVPDVHTFAFQREYARFWEDQQAVSPLWLSKLFSICCLSAILSEASGLEPSTPDDQPKAKTLFLQAAAQCLVLGGYTRPKPHVVEALSLYARCKYAYTLDPSRDLGVIFSITVRLAYRAGYHRDPDNFPQFSVFEGEMRRRTWSTLRQFDLMISFQLGLPNLIKPDSWDTRDPRNLIDADFDEASKMLPPSRPESEPTQILYFVVKSRLMTSFGKVCHHALSFKATSQEEIMALDNHVRESYATIPQILQIKPMSESLADPSYLIMVRVNAEFLYQKSLMVLHRKYMTQGYEYSTETCINAAMSVATTLVDLHNEFEPGGQLYADRWMLSSFTMNDFLLAVMVLCLSLSVMKRRNPSLKISEDPSAKKQFDMLQQCYEICSVRSASSQETKHVAEAVRVILTKLQPQVSLQQLAVPTPAPTMSTSQYNSTPSNTNPIFPPQFASYPSLDGTHAQQEVNLTPLSLNERSYPTTAPNQESVDMSFDQQTDPIFNSLFSPNPDTFNFNVDWTTFDQFLVNPTAYEDAILAHRPTIWARKEI